MTKERQHSSGIIITDGEQFLIGHVTNSSFWSVPKGLVDPGESEIDAAVRETQEETDIIIAPETLTYLGKFPYRDKKDLSLFVYKTETKSLPPTSMMKCDSVVFVSELEGFPEIDSFQYVKFSEMEQYLNKSMFALFQKIDLEKLLTKI
jgi:8-oxo-dGTP pyrophosphatase MutT (NUDIX family)